MKILIEPNTRLFVDIEGTGLVADGSVMREKPTLILLHGGPGYDHVSFKPSFSQLADIAQIVYYDHRGHGRSDPRPSHELTLDYFADDVVRLCDALGISKPIVLGQSFGGFVAQHYIARHPAHASKVVLSSTAATLSLARKLEMFQRLGGVAARNAAELFWLSPNASTWPEYQRLCKPLYTQTTAANNHAAQRATFNQNILFNWANSEQQNMNLLPGLAHAQCPVLVLAGELDPVCPLADAQDMAKALPPQWVQLATFKACGHGVWRDAPEAAFAQLRQFILA